MVDERKAAGGASGLVGGGPAGGSTAVIVVAATWAMVACGVLAGEAAAVITRSGPDGQARGYRARETGLEQGQRFRGSVRDSTPSMRLNLSGMRLSRTNIYKSTLLVRGREFSPNSPYQTVDGL